MYIYINDAFWQICMQTNEDYRTGDWVRYRPSCDGVTKLLLGHTSLYLPTAKSLLFLKTTAECGGSAVNYPYANTFSAF